MQPGILIICGIAKGLVSASTFSIILSFYENFTPWCPYPSATKVADSSLRASASVAIYSLPNTFSLRKSI